MYAWILRSIGLAFVAFLIGPQKRKQVRVLWDRFWNVSAALVLIIVTVGILTIVVRLVLSHLGHS